MELLYLWINKSYNGYIQHQEFNFSPLYKFHVDDNIIPTKIGVQRLNTVNVFECLSINNITAVVGSNGAGKTTLISFLANNDCHYKFDHGNDYERFGNDKYDRQKAIYVFIDADKLIVYHNLENELNCSEIELMSNGCKIYWNQKNNNTVPLYEIRNQLIVYLTNSSIVPDALKSYSQSQNTYNVNIHPKSLYIIADKFYKRLFNKSEFDKFGENDKGFARIIKDRKDENTFQELLDVLYFQYMNKNSITDYVGKFIDQITVTFDTIFHLIDDKYHSEFELIIANQDDSFEHENKTIQKYFDKEKAFFNQYGNGLIKEIIRNNITCVLYINLLFEAYFYEDDFKLPQLESAENIHEQLSGVFDGTDYFDYYQEIKDLDDILSQCESYQNLIDNPEDLGNKYDKIVINSSQNDLYKDFCEFIKEKFKSQNSYVLRYIKIENINMSSGERAMQNFFSWVTLIPELDNIIGINRDKCNNILLLIDEIDLYSHPEWQRKTINQLINTIKHINNEKSIQIIITSHSPLILSDFPRQNIIYMNNLNGKSIAENKENHKQTFGANIYTLLNDTFFLKREQ